VSLAARARDLRFSAVIVQKLSSNPVLLFWIDGLGGIGTAVMLGLVLPMFEAWIGLPTGVMRVLAAVGLFCAAFSLLHATKVLRHSPSRLRFIAAVNASYCLGTLVLLAIYRDRVQAMGLAYFAAELAIILTLVAIELRAASQRPAI
jgi:hypothetical protein